MGPAEAAAPTGVGAGSGLAESDIPRPRLDPLVLSRVVGAAAAVAGVLLRLVIAFRPIDYADRFFVPDDTYYTLSIARALAHGLGPTADGVTLTNGFQPLLAFLLMPVFWFTRNPDGGLRAAWVLLSVADGALALALAEVVRRAVRTRPNAAAATAAVTWSLSPLAVSYALSGMEVTLALLCSCLLVLAWSRAHRTGRPGHFAVAGALAGLAMLARIDTALLVMVLGAWEVWLGSRKAVSSIAAGGAAALAPWWVYELVRFHTVIPQSGLGVRAQVKMHQLDERWLLTFPRQVALGLGSIVEAPLARLVDGRTWLFDSPGLALLLTPLVMALMVWLSLRWLRTERENLPFQGLMAFGLLVWLFYVIYLPATWFFPRYLAPVHLAVVVLLSAATARLMAWMPDPRALWKLTGAALVLVVAPLGVDALFVFRSPSTTLDVGMHGAKGYRQPIRDLLEVAPRGVAIGSLQSGALGYFGGALRTDLRIFNLDGVVDSEALRAFRGKSLASLARGRGITYLVDWAYNLENFVRYSGDPRLGMGSFRPVATGLSQGSNQLRLVEVLWPSPLKPGAPLVVPRPEDLDEARAFTVDELGRLNLWSVVDGSWNGPFEVGTQQRFKGGNELALVRLDDHRVAAGGVDQSGSLSWATSVNGGPWTGPDRVGREGAYVPGAVVAGCDHLDSPTVDVVSVDARGALTWVPWSPDGGWRDPVPVTPEGLFPPGAPVAIDERAGSLDLTDVVGVDVKGALSTVPLSASSGWQPPLRISGEARYKPGAWVSASRSSTNGAPLIFAIDEQGTLTVAEYSQGRWGEPVRVGSSGTFPSGAPVVSSLEFGIDRQMDAFAVDQGGHVRVSWRIGNGKWNGPDPITKDIFPAGGHLAVTGEPDNDHQTDVLAIDSSGAIQSVSVTNRQWRLGSLIQ